MKNITDYFKSPSKPKEANILINLSTEKETNSIKYSQSSIDRIIENTSDYFKTKPSINIEENSTGLINLNTSEILDKVNLKKNETSKSKKSEKTIVPDIFELITADLNVVPPKKTLVQRSEEKFDNSLVLRNFLQIDVSIIYFE